MTDNEWDELKHWRKNNKDLAWKAGDPHPTRDGFVFCEYTRRASNGERWVSEDYFARKKAYVKGYHEENKEILKVKNRERDKRNIESRRSYRRKYVEANREAVYRAQRKWYHENIDRARASRRAYAERNKEKLRVASREKAKRRYAEDKETLLETARRWRERNRDYFKQWHKNNKERRKERRNRRLKEDPFYAVICRARGRTLSAFRKRGYKKTSKTADLLGCDWITLKEHIESQFVEGMSWDNRSEWHIDHIVPYSVAKTQEDVEWLSYYKNLRPLWKHENMKKSGRFAPS